MPMCVLSMTIHVERQMLRGYRHLFSRADSRLTQGTSTVQRPFDALRASEPLIVDGGRLGHEMQCRVVHAPRRRIRLPHITAPPTNADVSRRGGHNQSAHASQVSSQLQRGLAASARITQASLACMHACQLRLVRCISRGSARRGSRSSIVRENTI